MPLVGLTGGVCTSQAQEIKGSRRGRGVVPGFRLVSPLAPRKQSAHVSPHFFLIMSKKHLFELKKLTGFWFNPKATEYLLSIPSHLKPRNKQEDALLAAQARHLVLLDVLDSFPELPRQTPESPYQEGFRDGYRDLRLCVQDLLEKTKQEMTSLRMGHPPR